MQSDEHIPSPFFSGHERNTQENTIKIVSFPSNNISLNSMNSTKNNTHGREAVQQQIAGDEVG